MCEVVPHAGVLTWHNKRLLAACAAYALLLVTTVVTKAFSQFYVLTGCVSLSASCTEMIAAKSCWNGVPELPQQTVDPPTHSNLASTYVQ